MTAAWTRFSAQRCADIHHAVASGPTGQVKVSPALSACRMSLMNAEERPTEERDCHHPALLCRTETERLRDMDPQRAEEHPKHEAEIEVQPRYGLTDEQVESMILESFDSAEEDFRQRQVIEARNEAETILSALDKSKKSSAWGQLPSSERKQIAKLEKALQDVKQQDDYQKIRKAIDALNQGTMRLAELMMDTAVTTALKGKTMEQADMGESPETGHPVAKADFE